jgi:hypothetical protein
VVVNASAGALLNACVQNDDSYLGRSDLEHLSDFMKTSDSRRPLGKMLTDMANAGLPVLDFSTFAVMVAKHPHLTAPVDPLWRALQPLSGPACELVRQLRLQGHIQFLEPAPMGRLAEPKQHLTVLKEQVTRSVQPLPRSRSLSPGRRLSPAGMSEAAQGQGGTPGMGGGGAHHYPQASYGGGQLPDDRAWSQQQPRQYPQPPHVEAQPQRSRSVSPSRGMNVLMHSGSGRTHSPGRGGFAMAGAGPAVESQSQRFGGNRASVEEPVYLHDEGGASQATRGGSPRRGQQLERYGSMPMQRDYGRLSPDPYRGPWRDNPLAQWDIRAGDARSQSPLQRQGQLHGGDAVGCTLRDGSLRLPSPHHRQPVSDAEMLESVVAALGAGSSPRRQASRALPSDYYARLQRVARQRSPSPQF